MELIFLVVKKVCFFTLNKIIYDFFAEALTYVNLFSIHAHKPMEDKFLCEINFDTGWTCMV